MNDLISLAAKVEGLSGPDRETDIAIKAAAHGGVALKSPINGEWCVYRAGVDDPRAGRLLDRPRSVTHEQWINDRYTASLDAAMTLVPEGLGVGWRMTDGAGGPTAEIWDIDLDRATERYHVAANPTATPALALTAAALRAQGADHV